MTALARLSGDAQVFLEKVWASHVHVHHTEPDLLGGLLSLGDVDGLLTSSGLRAPALRLAQDGSVLPASRFTRPASLAGQPLTGLVDARKVLDLFEGGASVVLQGLHRYWPPLEQLVRELERELGHPCQANAYLTPPGSQGFAVHSDTHDVFVLQTHGTKLWEVHDETGAREVLMEPGTVMYLPTGTPHAARAQETASLHVTVGINQVTWRQLLMRVTAAMVKDERYDGRLPAGYPDHPERLADALSDHLRTLARHVSAQDVDELSTQQVTRFLSTRNPSVAGGLEDRLALVSLADETLLTRRPGSVCHLVPGGDRLRVLLGDRELRVPSFLEEPLRHLADRDSFRPADLADWLDEHSRLVLLRRLVREGLLRVDG